VALDVAQQVPELLLVITVSLMERVFQTRIANLRGENVNVQLKILIHMLGNSPSQIPPLHTQRRHRVFDDF
jgi:hypothetical protein